MAAHNNCSVTLPIEVRRVGNVVQTFCGVCSLVGAAVVLRVVAVLGADKRRSSAVWPLVLPLAICDLVYASLLLLWSILWNTGALSHAVCRATMPLWYMAEYSVLLWSAAVAFRLSLALVHRSASVRLWWFHLAVWPLPVSVAIAVYANPSAVYVVQGQGFCVYAFQRDDYFEDHGIPSAPPPSQADRLVTSAFYLTAAVALACMFAYMVTAACDRRVGAAVRSRNVGRLQRYVIGASLLLGMRVLADAMPCSARPGPAYWTYFVYFPLFLIGLLNAAVLGPKVFGPLLQGVLLLPVIALRARARSSSEVAETAGDAATGWREAIQRAVDEDEPAAGTGLLRTDKAPPQHVRDPTISHVRFGPKQVFVIPSRREIREQQAREHLGASLKGCGGPSCSSKGRSRRELDELNARYDQEIELARMADSSAGHAGATMPPVVPDLHADCGSTAVPGANDLVVKTLGDEGDFPSVPPPRRCVCCGLDAESDADYEPFVFFIVRLFVCLAITLSFAAYGTVQTWKHREDSNQV
jgi:hypothetical protein